MVKLKHLALGAFLFLGNVFAHADEGMWLMGQLSTQYPKMRERGLRLEQYDIYNEQGTSLKDAVVIFGKGCTGEVISSQGLILTNYHCGFDDIQALSSVKANHMKEGYWAQSMSQELPAKGLTVAFIESIEDVSAYILSELKKEGRVDQINYLSPKDLAELAKRKAGVTAPGVEVEIKPFYGGHQFLMFTKKVYSDIRFVGAPPSTIAQFGADTDNWVYPRHAADFALFRIYADAAGNPVPYSPSNVPLKPKRWFNISTGGVQEGDFTMIMGFPGRTNHFYIPEEVREWKQIDNDIRIRVRGIRQNVMLQEMLKDPKVNIQYAAKYASSQNGHKRAIGANWGIEVRQLDLEKEEQIRLLLQTANPWERKKYQEAFDDIKAIIHERAELRKRLWYLLECFIQGVELLDIPLLMKGKESDVEKFYKDFSPQVEYKIALAMLDEYLTKVSPSERPKALNDMLEAYKTKESLLDALCKSRYTTKSGFEQIRKMKQAKKGQGQLTKEDLLFERFTEAIETEYKELTEALKAYDNRTNKARKTYIGGLIRQQGRDNMWSDANSTLRFTYGTVKGYSPRDGVYYHPRTTLDGVIAKIDSTSWEFNAPIRLKEIYHKQTYGKENRWAIQVAPDKWKMPVNFCATTHTTGGNSGSPVVNAYGHLIGINFDRNWEGVGGDIQYLGDYQRSIICDIRYIMMLIEEYGKCHRLIEEMSLVKYLVK